jgi:MFS family permease
VLWCAVLPAFLALALLVIAVPEPEGMTATKERTFPISRAALGRLSARYWWVVVVGAVLTMARFSEAFLILRAQQIGLGLTWIPTVLVLMNAVYALAAYPAGVLSDRMSRPLLLMIGMTVLIGADLTLAWLPTLSGVFLGAALWGLHMGLTQGLLSALVADAVPVELRGTAFGIFSLICGAMMVVAGGLAGYLWDGFGAPATFLTGAVFTALALAALLLVRDRKSVH